MATLPRWLASAVVAAGWGLASLPAPAQEVTVRRVMVDAADVVLRGGQPYYRHGRYGDSDRLIVRRDRYGRPMFYRVVRYNNGYYGSYGYGNGLGTEPVNTARRVNCNRNGNCKVTYYDARYDRGGYRSHRRHGGGRGHGRDDD